MQLKYEYLGEEITLDAEQDGDCWRIRLPDGSERLIKAIRNSEDSMQITEYSGGNSSYNEESFRAYRIPFLQQDNTVTFAYQGETYRFIPAESRRKERKKTTASGSLIAPMAGIVSDVLVIEGEKVDASQPLVQIEAMKVIATLEAPFAGIIQRVYVSKSQTVGHGDALVDVIPMEVEEDTV